METAVKLLGKLNERLTKKGTLLIIWGWMMGAMYATEYLVRIELFTHSFMDIVVKFLPFVGFSISVIYVLYNRQENWIKSDLRIAGVWLAAIAGLIIINQTLWKVTGQIDFTLQHPIFMVIIAFALIVTGLLKSYDQLLYGGITFGLLAFICASFPLTTQLVWRPSDG